MDYGELNKVVPPVHASVPNIAQLANEVSESLGTYYFVLDLANTFISIPVDPQNQDQIAFSWNREHWMFQVLPPGYLHNPTICHGLVAKISVWKSEVGVALHHYIDGIMLTGNYLATLHKAAESLLEHLEGTGWAVNHNKSLGPLSNS